MPIYLGNNNITGGFTTAEKKQFNNSINLINEQLDINTIKNEYFVNVMNFKCDDGEYVKGNGIHDDTTGIQRAIDFADENGLDVIVPYEKSDYIITDTIKVGTNCNLIMIGRFAFKGINNITCIELGNNNSYSKYKKHRLRVVKSSFSDGNDYNENGKCSTGIKMINFSYSNVEIVECFGFTVGIECIAANSKGFYFNSINGGEVRAVKCLQIVTENDGWSNGNSFNNFGLVVLATDKYSNHIKQFVRSGSYGSNTWVFNSLRFEGKTTETIPIELNKALYYTFSNIRTENATSGNIFMKVRNSSGNKVSGMFINRNIDIDREDGADMTDGNNIINTATGLFISEVMDIEFSKKQKLLYSTKDIENKIINDNGKYGISDLVLLNYDTLSPKKISNINTTATIDENGYLNCPSGYARPSCLISSDICKKFRIKLGNESSITSRIRLALLDSNDEPITDENVIFKSDYVGTKLNKQLYFYTTNDLLSYERDFYIEVSEAVKKIYFLIPTISKDFNIYALEEGAKNLTLNKDCISNIKILSSNGNSYIITIDSEGNIKSTIE